MLLSAMHRFNTDNHRHCRLRHRYYPHDHHLLVPGLRVPEVFADFVIDVD